MEAIVFKIYENENGNIHLSDFGIKIGGANRENPFVIKVFDRRGKEIATSEIVTAKILGIAEGGKIDYNKNKYRQSHFFRETGSGFKAASPIAKRITWQYAA